MAQTLTAFAGCVMFVASTMAAQVPPSLPRPTPPASPGTTRQSVPPTITVTGCLKAWDASLTPPAGTPAGAAAGRFLLTNLEPSPPAPTAPGSVVDDPPPPNTQYVVTAEKDVDLAAHVNRKVRIEGRVAMQDAAAATAQPPATRGESASRADRWTALTATSIAMVASTCERASR